jgi:outer membrane protein assembly factor BamB
LTTFTSLAQQSGGEWAQWRGPDRTGVSQEKGLLKSWAPEGPKLAWRSEGLGYGHATPSIAGGRVFGMGLRGEDEVVWALNVADGKQVWSTRIAGAIRLGGGQGGYGPRSTPTVDGNRLYALGVGGELVCMEVATGKLLWHKNLVSDFGGSVPRWGYSESPLVDGEKVVATPGGRQATLIALNKMNGEVIWKAQVPEGDGAQYSSCIAADVGGQRQIIQFTHGGVIGIAAKDGKFLWKNNHAAFNTANCSTPIYRDNHVFAAAGYNKGGVLVKLTTNPDGVAATQVYHAPQMRNQHGGMILVGDHLYGFDDGVGLTCLNFKTGEIAWDNRSVGKGSLVYADGLLIARSERGPVALIEATPTGYVEKGRFTPPSDPNPSPEPQSRSTWPHPVIAGGRLYLRHMNILLCYELKS